MEWEAWAARAPFLFPWKSALEAVREIVRVSKFAALEGNGSEIAEVGENEIEKEGKESEAAPLVETKKGGRGGRAPSTRKRGIGARGR